MSKRDIEGRKIELTFRFAFYALGLVVALVLALANSQFAGEAFALVGGLMGGDAFSTGMKSID